ncbi:MAG: aminotransferase class I/II-fold pyridoxal phosphate-dependent enzyme [Acidobacteriaceae bacterium]|nr:aminotransferase class I/II-fold pyridoxal phosphate-dependent enzyme [Acidobacteriaceae bacterium]
MRAMGSAYMEWVKTQSHAAYNLANSGVKSFELAGLHADFNSLSLSGPGAYGYAPLVKAIAAKCGVNEDSVATAQGTSGANHLAMAAAIEPGDDVLIEHPAYPLLWETAQYVGAHVRYFERLADAKFALDLGLIERAMTPRTRLIVISNLHNPSCAYTDQATLKRLGVLAREAGAKVLVDEVYLDLLFEDAPATSYKLGDEFIVTNSLTKVYGLSGLRCGWILAEPDLVRRIYRLNDLFGVNNPYVTDQLSCIALGRLKAIGQWARELLDTNRALANEFIEATPELECEQLQAGTVLFPRLDVPVEEFCRVLRQRYDTVVTPGQFFGAPERIRLGIGGQTSLFSEGLNRVHAALDEMGRAVGR